MQRYKTFSARPEPTLVTSKPHQAIALRCSTRFARIGMPQASGRLTIARHRGRLDRSRLLQRRPFQRANASAVAPLATVPAPPYSVAMTQPDHQRLLIVDFGSQVTQLIARRLRESRIYCEIHPYQKVDAAFLAAFRPQAVILSGGPASVTEPDSPRAAPEVFTLGVPVLGICYGQQAMMAQLGGTVEAGHHREFGRA